MCRIHFHDAYWATLTKTPKYLTSEQRKGLQTQLCATLEDKVNEEALRAITLGAEANSITSIGWPCVHRAAMSGMTEVVRVLLDKGADPKLKAGIGGDFTALRWASSGGHTSIVNMILDYEDEN